MDLSFKLFAIIKNKIIVILFMLFYHDTIVLSILVMYTLHTTSESFSSIYAINLDFGYFYTCHFQTVVA
jgi:hypothetical protein